MLEKSEDKLLGGRVTLRQPGKGYRSAIDPVLLAAAAPVQSGQAVVDLGCGSGAAALCLLARVPNCHVMGIDVQPDMVALARENAPDDRFSAVCGDVAALDLGPGQEFDHVISNPPYLPRERAAPNKLGDMATVETVPLAQWIGVALSLLRDKGCLTLIHRADRLDAILAALQGEAGDTAVLPLWPRADEPAQRVIVSARLGVRTPLTLLPGLVLHRADGSYTDAAEAVLRHGKGLALTASANE